MRIAIMQPYAFPYLGYFQLARHAEHFVLLDDVSYIKKGWINRNRIVTAQGEYLFTIPLVKPSQNKKINTIELCDFKKNATALLNIVRQSYKKMPYFEQGYNLLERCFTFEGELLVDFISHSLDTYFGYLQIAASVHHSSVLDPQPQLTAQNRIIHLNKLLDADTYLNLPGGQQLYDKCSFAEKGLQLEFIDTSVQLNYQQPFGHRLNHMSIIDVTMCVSKADIQRELSVFRTLS
jgi:hypothetical protein